MTSLFFSGPRNRRFSLLALFLFFGSTFIPNVSLSSLGSLRFVSEAAAQRYAEFIPDDFVLFWPSPVRAHPNVPMRFRFSVYEMNNQPLTWRLTGAPQGMEVAADGRVTFTPTSAQVGSYSVTVRVTRQDGAFRERTFPLAVDASKFFFVATNGSDSNPGTLSQPFRTISKAMFSITSGNGKTIYIRGGTYRETYNWERSGVMSPFRGKSFSADSPVEIVGYPGESAVLDCGFQGHGFWFFSTNFGVLDNVTVINAAADERGGIVVSESNNIVIRDTVVHDAHWSHNTNCTGYNISSAGSVVDGAIGYNNRDTASDHWNSSNFLVYLANTTAGETTYILNSKSWGSVTGFKVKHAGPKRLIIHDCETFDHEFGYAVGSTGSSIRYSVSFRDKTGIHLGVADPNPYTTGAILVDHNTVVNASGAALNLQDGYGISAPVVITNNVFVNTLRAAGGGEYDGRLLQLWLYASDAVTRPITSEHNLFFSPSQDSIVRLGSAVNKSTSWTLWRTLGHDQNSVFANPGFGDIASGNFNMPVSSAANFSDGTFVGWLRPGMTASSVGVPTSQAPPLPPSGVRVQQTN